MPDRPTNGLRAGSTSGACTGSEAPSAIQGPRNHVRKTIGKPCAGKPHARIERGMGKQGLRVPAPLTTNDMRALDIRWSAHALRTSSVIPLFVNLVRLGALFHKRPFLRQ